MTVIECCCVFLTVAFVGGVAAVMQRVQVRNEVERYWLARERRRDENRKEKGFEE